ncbi:MAG: hypothetical protein JWM27_1334 [Gemmatimonadetes bacterium]|nr:hypothetical protein [Gemmatimonadota bacterium]
MPLFVSRVHHQLLASVTIRRYCRLGSHRTEPESTVICLAKMISKRNSVTRTSMQWHRGQDLGWIDLITIATALMWRFTAKGRLDPSSTLLSPKIALQLKATAVADEPNPSLTYSLKIKNYDELRSEKFMVPRLLVVLVMPTNSSDWISSDDSSLITRRCAYWCNLRGLPESTNRTRQVVRIPRVGSGSVRNSSPRLNRKGAR